MRNVGLALIATVSVCSAVGATTASAMEFPYCLQGTDVSIPGDCQYRSYQDCIAAVSSRNLYCNINPRIAYGRRQRVRNYR
jgi:hypothetical protein